MSITKYMYGSWKTKSDSSQQEDTTPTTKHVTYDGSFASASGEKPNRHCENYILVPPDGGHLAWLCVFIALYGHMVTDGLVLTFIVNRRRHRELKGQVAFLVGSAAMSLVSILSWLSVYLSDDKEWRSFIYVMCGYPTGPLSCALINQFGFRIMTVTGALITSSALLGCYFTENLYLISLMYIIAGGIGCSLLKTSSELLPSYYFCRRRVVASSLATFGSAFGIMFMPISSMLLGHEFFGFLFISACFIPLIAFGLLIRPLKGISVEVLSTSEKTIKFRDFVQAEAKAEKGPSGRLVCGTYVNNAYPRVLDIVALHRCKIILPDTATLNAARRASKPREWWGTSDVVVEVNSSLKSQGARPLYRTDLFYHGFVGHLHEYAIQDSFFDYQLFVSRAPSKKDLEEESKKICCFPESFRRVLATMLDFKLMSNTPYCLVMSCVSFSFIGSYVPYFYLEDRALFLGYTENQAMGLVFYFGIGFLFSKVLSATMLILDRTIQIEGLIFLAMLISSAIALISSFFQKFYYFICYSIAYGAIVGLMPNIRMLFLYELLSLDNLTTAVGIMYIFQGTLSFCGLAVASFLRANFDVNVAYYYAGMCDVLAASMILPLRILHERLRNKLTAYV